MNGDPSEQCNFICSEVPIEKRFLLILTDA